MDRKQLAAKPLRDFKPEEIAQLYKEAGFTPVAGDPCGKECCPLGLLFFLETGGVYEGHHSYPVSLARFDSWTERFRFGEGFDSRFTGRPLSFNEHEIDLKKARKAGYRIGEYLRNLRNQKGA